MRTFLLLTAILCSLPALAQEPELVPVPIVEAPHYEDIVHVLGLGQVEGYVTDYQYGKSVTIHRRYGSRVTFPWEQVKRVTFKERRVGSRSPRRPQPAVGGQQEAGEGAFILPPPPPRKHHHEILVHTNLSQSNTDPDLNRFRNRELALGIGASYSMLWDHRWLRYGGGVDLALMNNRQRESVIAGLGIVEALYGEDRVRPFLRLEAGPSLPLGGGPEGASINARRVSWLVQPTIGLDARASHDPWINFHFDLGYRFLNSRFDIETANLELITQRIQYRRLVLRAGLRF